MLQNIHDKVKGWFANAVMAILAIAFALWGVEFYLGGGAGANEIAKVNDTSITENQLNVAFQRAKEELQNQNKALMSLTPEEQTELRQQVLQELIKKQALADNARKTGLHITSAQLDDLILQMPSFQENGSFSPQRFQQVLNIFGYTQDQFIADITNSLLIMQMQLGIEKSTFALPNETKQMAQLMEQKRDISYAIIPAANFVNTAKISDDAINNYYQQHSDQFKTLEKVQIAYLQLNAENLRKQIKVNDQELQQYYQTNQANFVKANKTLPFSAVKEEIAKIVTNQKLQQLFSDQSQKLSDLTYTNPNSLEPAAQALGLSVQTSDYFTRKGDKTGLTAKSQIIDTAFNDDVLKNNNNSNLIPLGEGDVIVLRVKNYQPATVLPLAEVKEPIIKQLKVQLAQTEAQKTGEQLIGQLKNSNSLKELSVQHHLNWETKNNLTRQSTGIEPAILRKAFSLGKVNDASPNLIGTQLANGDYAIINISKIIDNASSSLNPQQFKVIQNELENTYSQLDYQLYAANVLKQAKIKIK